MHSGGAANLHLDNHLQSCSTSPTLIADLFKSGNFDHACHLTVPFLSHVGIQSCMCMLQWLADRYQGPPREGSTKAGPRLYEPQGKRFTLLQGDSPSSRVFQYVPLPVSKAVLTSPFFPHPPFLFPPQLKPFSRLRGHWSIQGLL